MLAMGFTGTKTLSFKLAYVGAFNDMAARIKKTSQKTGLKFTPDDCDGAAEVQTTLKTWSASKAPAWTRN